MQPQTSSIRSKLLCAFLPLVLSICLSCAGLYFCYTGLLSAFSHKNKVAPILAPVIAFHTPESGSYQKTATLLHNVSSILLSSSDHNLEIAHPAKGLYTIRQSVNRYPSSNFSSVDSSLIKKAVKHSKGFPLCSHWTQLFPLYQPLYFKNCTLVLKRILPIMPTGFEQAAAANAGINVLDNSVHPPTLLASSAILVGVLFLSCCICCCLCSGSCASNAWLFQRTTKIRERTHDLEKGLRESPMTAINHARAGHI